MSEGRMCTEEQWRNYIMSVAGGEGHANNTPVVPTSGEVIVTAHRHNPDGSESMTLMIGGDVPKSGFEDRITEPTLPDDVQPTIVVEKK